MHNKLYDFLQIKVTKQCQIVFTVFDNFQNLFILFTQVMRQHDISILIYQWNGLLTVIADNIVNARSREFQSEVINSIG